MHKRAWTGSPTVATKFTRAGGLLIARTASKLTLVTERTVAQEVGPRYPSPLQSSEVNTQWLVLAVMPSKC